MPNKVPLTHQQTDSDKKSVAAHYLNSFTAMRTGMIFLFLLMAAAVIGTLIPPDPTIAVLGDVYHTWWFRLLGALVCLNMAACSARRLPALWRRTFYGPDRVPAALRDMPLYRQVRFAPAAGALPESVAERLAACRLRVRMAGGGLYADCGRVAPWGALAVHGAVLMIAAGALYGSVYGYSSEIALPVGTSCEIEAGTISGINSPFSIKLNGFDTVYYPNGTVSDWISDISIERGGAEVLRREVKVNHPLDYGGIKIYQYSYGTAIQTEITDTDGLTAVQPVPESDIMKAGSIAVRPVRYLQDVNSTMPAAFLPDQARGPHVLYIIYENGREAKWGAARLGETIFLGNGSTVRFAAKTPYSGIEIKRDPGIPLVWAGFMLLAAGFFVSLYTKRIRLWLVAAPGKGMIEIGGYGRREVFDAVCAELADPPKTSINRQRSE